ncbi:hypothetical protein ZEAMMB73_Zm00001d019435 [Zea mays]|uniref:protein-serine/threonine phosphatase n=1 Tax=Zea mays TaxID=4577 RepID=A0A1D6HXF5_MAIZE|nr:hypothetical protein ZEAMMB73_Zm00001d019435 [Zea mays]
MFVGIYDGFNRPDATDYLVVQLYTAVCRELDGVLRLHADEPAEAGHNGGGRALARGQGCHHDVLDVLARALRSTEVGYFMEAEARAAECPELAMVGSCVLVALVKGADVYVMNVGDSRAVLAQRAEPEPEKSVPQSAPEPEQSAGAQEERAVCEQGHFERS